MKILNCSPGESSRKNALLIAFLIIFSTIAGTQKAYSENTGLSQNDEYMANSDELEGLETEIIITEYMTWKIAQKILPVSGYCYFL